MYLVQALQSRTIITSPYNIIACEIWVHHCIVDVSEGIGIQDVGICSY